MAKKVKLSSEEKVLLILQEMSKGKSREKLAEELNYKDWRGIDTLMRRRGFVYDNDKYVLMEDKQPPRVEPQLPQKVRRILKELENGNRDLQDIASKAGFRSHRDLADYMKAQGWQWSSEKETYIKEGYDMDVSSESEAGVDVGMDVGADLALETNNPKDLAQDTAEFNQYLPLLKFLASRQTELEQILGEAKSEDTFPRYKIAGGVTVTKSVSMGSNLDHLIRDFSTDFGVSQREIVETALIQFLERYGYAQQIQSLLHRG